MKKIIIAQHSYKPGHIEENEKHLQQVYTQAASEMADLVVSPLQALCGFRPGNLLSYSTYVARYCAAAENLIAHSKNTPFVFEIPLSIKDDSYEPLWIWAQNGRAYKASGKLCLFIEGWGNICIRRAHPFHLYPELQQDKPDCLILLDAHALVAEQEAIRFQTLCLAASKIPTLIYANQAGGQEEYVLTGFSAAFNEEGRYSKTWPWWISSTLPCSAPVLDKDTLVHQGLVCALRDYAQKGGLTSALVGLSGGIDSSVVLPLAVEALGAQQVLGIIMPSPFSTPHSVKDAIELAQNLGSAYEIIPIDSLYHTFLKQLDPIFQNTPFGLAEENLQARIRGNLLMAISNKNGHLLLNTSNKSESACGYGTLYGDLCGGISLIGDLYKSEVYSLARHINMEKEIIPLNCINKPPSAELRPDQKDSDSLPDYDIIEKILRFHLEKHYSETEIVKQGIDKDSVYKVLRLFRNSGYKRRQTAPSIRLSTSVLSDINLPMMM